jgi:16S rRNA (cytidine1402-2'-O)-methyltransferase
MAKLIMLPVPIADQSGHSIPAYVAEAILTLPVFVMERGKTGRRLLKEIQPSVALQDKVFIEMGEAPHTLALAEVMSHLKSGRDVAVVSESGCPGVADPGAVFAEGAHKNGYQVVPLVGPSSILLALMASGFNGQQFAFIGYVTNKKEDLPKELKLLEEHSAKTHQTQIWIETPYRNKQMLENAVKSLSPQTRLCVAYDLTGPDEKVQSMSVSDWRKHALPALDKKPAIFLILA